MDRAYSELRDWVDMPYGVMIQDFTDEQIWDGTLRAADEKAEVDNRAIVRRVLEAAVAGVVRSTTCSWGHPDCDFEEHD